MNKADYQTNKNANRDGADSIGAAQFADNSDADQSGSAIIALANEIGETVLKPSAEATDCADGPNRTNFCALAESGLLGIAVPKEFGGLDASGVVQREVTEVLASYCGVTTFTQAQHHGPCRMILNSKNDSLKQVLLPRLATGAMMCGISFAHLRRPGPPILSARAVDGGYRLNGHAPWVTGWGLMNQFVFGAALDDGRHAYVWSPVRRTDFRELFKDAEHIDIHGGGMQASNPIALCAMNASATVEVSIHDWFIPSDHLLFESDRATMERNDQNGVLGATALPMGCIRAGVRLLGEVMNRRPLPAIERTREAFRAEYEALRHQIAIQSGRSGEEGFFEEGVKTRAWCIELASRISLAAVAASSGAANLRANPAQRLLREAMFYTVQAQTQEVMAATLHRLESAAGPIA